MNQIINNRVNAVLDGSRVQKGDPKFLKRLWSILALMFLVIGIVIVVSQIDSYSNYKKLVEGGYYTYGEITDVTREVVDNHDGDSDIYYLVKGEYTVDGDTYEFSFRSDTSKREGREIKLFYEEGNPENYVQEDYSKARFLTGFMCLGVSFILSLYAYKAYRELKNKDLT